MRRHSGVEAETRSPRGFWKARGPRLSGQASPGKGVASCVPLVQGLGSAVTAPAARRVSPTWGAGVQTPLGDDEWPSEPAEDVSPSRETPTARWMCCSGLGPQIHRILDQPPVLFPSDRNLIQAGSENNYCILRVVIIGRDMIECVHAY